MSATATQKKATGANGGGTSQKQPKGLYAKLHAASLAVENVEKKGKNTKQNYDYVRAEDVAAAATKAILAQGLLVDFEVVASEEVQITSKAGGSGMIVKVAGVLRVTDPDTGESLERQGMGSGSDYPGDKAIYKAMTGARKYALIHLLGIPIGDDPDEERKGQPSGGSGDEKPAQIGAGPAKQLIDHAWKVPAAKDQLQLAASHAAGRDVGDCSTKQKAIKAVGSLDFDQAQKLDDWINRKADEAAKEAAEADRG